MSRRAAILGLGERGRSWTRTCLDAGWTVRAFDPSGDAAGALVSEPDFRRVQTISEAVSKADWILCCLPDRLELVQMVLKRASAAAPEKSVLAVASRLHDVDALQACAIRAGQVFRLDETVQGSVTLDVTDRNGPEMRRLAEQAFAELSAARYLHAAIDGTDQRADAESA